MNKKIIFTAGGTGGHIFPAINLMKHFSQKNIEVLEIDETPAYGLETKLKIGINGVVKCK